MRVISGSARGRHLVAPKDMRVRPTADRVKEAVFNILAGLVPHLEGSRVLDLFAGTGSLGIETMSRGATSTVFVENHRDSISLVEKNIQITGFVSSARIIKKDVLAGIKILSREGQPFDLIFLDPPYEKGLTEKTLGTLALSPLLHRGTIVVAEYSARETLPPSFGSLTELDRRVYGDTAVSFFSSGSSPSATED